MGSGRANVDLPVVCKILALILCAVALALNGEFTRNEMVSDSGIYAAGSFIIVVGIFLGWSIFKDEVDKTFAGWMMMCGAIWSIGAGIGLVLYNIDNKRSGRTSTVHLVGGCFNLASGIVMLIDALHNLGVF